MKHFVCITCPNGCSLSIDEKTLEVTGNKCPRGKEYAKNELTCPKRTVCSSVKTTIETIPVVSVKTSQEIDKKMIFDLMNDLKKVVINENLPIGSVVIENYQGTGVNIITTTDLTKIGEN